MSPITAERTANVDYKLIVEEANDPILIAQAGRIKYPNRRLCQLLGYERYELVEQVITEFIYPEDIPFVVDMHKRRSAGESVPDIYPFRLVRKDGSFVWIEISAVKVDWDGESATCNYFRDITERKKAQDALKAALEETERTNQLLKATNEKLEEAHRVAMIDMKMAVNVQTSIFPKRTPDSDYWDVDFLFKPMVGVSGDLYDFYHKDGKLDGLALFDVSGHGIASGLLTILAKSTIFRRFHRGRDTRLSEVMQNINDDLIAQMNQLDNYYLTGLLLRFQEDTVEYASAAHTELLFKSGASGIVKPVTPKDRQLDGSILGLDVCENKFDALRFKTRPGDTLIAYSDCLIESRNAQNQQLTIEGLTKILSDSPPELTARGLIDYLVEKFYHFVGGDSLDDDLTVIVARRR